MTTHKKNTAPKQAGLFKSLWVMLASLALLAQTCTLAMVRSATGRITRQWVDDRIQIWTKQMLRLWGIKYRVYNPKKVKPKAGQATIMMCNHSSLFDIPLSFCAFPDTSLRMLAKKELGNLPFMGQGMKAADFPLVDRKNRQQAVKDLKAIHHLLETGIVMWIAPEGTRSPDGKLGAFKKGGFITAIETGAQIIPVGIRGAENIIPARTYRFYPNQTAEIHIGEPVDASAFTLDNKDELIQKVRNQMLTLVGESS